MRNTSQLEKRGVSIYKDDVGRDWSDSCPLVGERPGVDHAPTGLLDPRW